MRKSCGLAVVGLRQLFVQLAGLSPARLCQIIGLSTNLGTYTHQSLVFPPTLSTTFFNNLPLLFLTFSPLSTVPIKSPYNIQKDNLGVIV